MSIEFVESFTGILEKDEEGILINFHDVRALLSLIILDQMLVVNWHFLLGLKFI